MVEYSCNLAPDLMGEFVENVAKGMDTYSMRQPLGVRFRCHIHAKLHPTLCLDVSRASAATRKSWKEIKCNHHDSNVHAWCVGGCGHLPLQLSRHGAAVDVAARSDVRWAFCRA